MLTTVTAIYLGLGVTFPGPVIAITVLIILPPIVGFLMTWAVVELCWFLYSRLVWALCICRPRSSGSSES